MGFTAINSSSPPQQAPAPSYNSAGATHNHATADQQGTVASGYLGRGTADETIASGKPPHKKATTKSKKRATTAPNTRASKQRKTSNVDDAMPAKKARIASKKQAALQHEQPSKSLKNVGKTAQRQSREADSTSASSAVSVIVPSTSMSTLTATSQQTSYDAVKASSGHGTVLYNISSIPTKQQGMFAQSSTGRSRKTAKTPPTKSTGFSGTNKAPLPHQCDELFDLSDDGDDLGILFEQLAQQIEGSAVEDSAANSGTQRTTRNSAKNEPAKSMPAACSLPDEDEDFLGDDDDFTEAIAVADSLTKPQRASKKKEAPKAAKASKQLPTPANSDAIERVDDTENARTTDNAHSVESDTMVIDDEDEEAIELEKALKEAEKVGIRKRARKQNTRNVDEYESYGGALLDDTEKRLLDDLKSSTRDTDNRPLVRRPFPQPILDRSPIFGASNTTLLRTCFRLGEALNVGSQAVRANKNIILEIYARVVSSFRDGRKQHFIFRDLYHDKPPHIEGDFELWSQSLLWEVDSKVFLSAEERAEGVMCRAAARMMREGTKWRLNVLNVWEAGWEDVDAVAGIYAKPGDGVMEHEE